MRAERLGRIGFASFFVLLFVYMLVEAQAGFGKGLPRAALFPTLIGAVGLMLALAALAQDVRRREWQASQPDSEQAAVDQLPARVLRVRTLSIVGWVLGFFLAIWIIGFLWTVPVATLAYLIGARENWRITVLLTAANSVFFVGLFQFVLKVPFPPGLLFELLADAGFR